MSAPLRVLVTGTQGQVARAMMERGPAHGAVVTALGRPNLDLADPASIKRALERAACDVIVNAAAYTAVDKAESEPEAAMRVNGDGAGAVARTAASAKRPIVQLSTDYVFDGASSRPYVETDPTGPIGAYGRSKRAGEEAVAAATPDHAILRTAWVYSPFGANFVRTMLRLGATREALSVVADQHGAPTSALDIADAVLRVCANLYARPADASLRGVFHMTGAGEATWADFAREIFAEAERHGASPVRVNSIATKDYPTPARRPANSRLDTRKLAAAHGVELPHWRASTRDCVARLMRDAS